MILVGPGHDPQLQAYLERGDNDFGFIVNSSGAFKKYTIPQLIDDEATASVEALVKETFGNNVKIDRT